MAAIAAFCGQPIISVLAELRMDMWWLIPSSEPLEYIGEGLVFVGVLLEVLCERELILKSNEPRRDRLEGIGSWVLILGLAVSLAALIGTNEYFNTTIADLNLKAAQANDRAAANANEAASAEGRLRQLQIFALARHTGLVVSDQNVDVVDVALGAIVEKGHTSGGAVGSTDTSGPLLIFSGIKNPFWLPEQALAAPRQKTK